MTSWRTAWRNIRKAAGLPHVRFHAPFSSSLMFTRVRSFSQPARSRFRLSNIFSLLLSLTIRARCADFSGSTC
jgi:hypothetical protein